ncbi:MAG TPA: DUF433 domain-containing protein [Thermomicrobiales bacterium]|nr:DUF433 domain-containing protein [Thermomicrobiales bacterium]
MVPLSAFTIETAARLTGLSVHQLRRWDQTDFFVPSLADPNRQRPFSRIYSLQDIVGLRTIAKLIERGVSHYDLKRVRDWFGDCANEEWGRRRFYLVGTRVFFSHDDAVLAGQPIGQVAQPEILELERVAEEVEGRVKQLSQRGGDQIGVITRQRYIVNGQPVIAGTRIPTATIYAFHLRGFSTTEIIREFPRLTEKDIEAAIRYEEEHQALRPAG